MASFKKLNPAIFKKPTAQVLPETEYWKKYNAPVLVKEFGPVDYIDFSPVEPYYFAVSCSSRVQVYNPITKLVTKNLSKFQTKAYGGTFRSDGRLICAGAEEGEVKLFDLNTKNLLRVFRGHRGAVHRTFFTNDKVHIASFSDDKSVKVWDVATEKSVLTYEEHCDYVRAGCVSSVVPDILLSGGYDRSAKLYDMRLQKTVLSVDHGSPIESVLFLPSGSIFLTAGGNHIKIWDAVSGGRLLGYLSQHHKTVTCLQLASDNKRLVSGSLDRHVKIYDIASFKVLHSFTYSNAVLSVALSKEDQTLVVGMVDGLVSIQRREEVKPSVRKKKIASYKYALQNTPKNVDEIIQETQKEIIPKYDHFFRKFEFSKAFAAVLKPYIVNTKPEYVICVLQEIMKRKALHNVFTNLDSKKMQAILRYFIKYISDYRFTRILLEAIEIFLDVFEDNFQLQSMESKKMFLSLQKKFQEEHELLKELAILQGSLQLLLAGNSASRQTALSDISYQNLNPSTEAQQDLVVVLN